MAAALRDGVRDTGVTLFDLGGAEQGIVHVIAPELGLVLPGTSLICGYSHSCTNGAFGALAFGIGTSESTHALATGTLRQRKPAAMRIAVNGALGHGVTANDLALHLLARFGPTVAVGRMIEFSGDSVRALGMEARLTLCNMSIELGARSGMIAPDDTTFEYLRGRRYAPVGDASDRAVGYWQTLHSDRNATFALDHEVDASTVAPMISWGTGPDQSIAVDAAIPDPAARARAAAALDYMALPAGKPILGTPVDWVFIGSCTNSRLFDLQAAAAIVRGRRVMSGVTAWVVPGSERVRREAEAAGLDRVFTAAGFSWREPGCGMCVAANGEPVPPGARCVSTSNRNFVGRQGPGARTHLASPAMAAAAAVTGMISDVRCLA